MKKIPPPQQLPSDSSGQPTESIHIPVLLKDTVQLLAPSAGETYLDLTAGYGGHASLVIETIGAKNATLVDRDENAIRALSSLHAAGATLMHQDFLSAARQLVASGNAYDMLLVDLGVSSPQLDRAERGFSIQREGPLDMRMDVSAEQSAYDIINRSSKKALIEILKTFGEESPSRAEKIAQAIVTSRPLETTSELAQVVMDTHRGGYQKTHPATRTFQAIRIAVNQELQQIRELMPLIPRLLKPGGRVAIISFHSLEDRIVKQYFAEENESGYESELRILQKAIKGAINDVHNPRARSAILRAAVKK